MQTTHVQISTAASQAIGDLTQGKDLVAVALEALREGLKDLTTEQRKVLQDLASLVGTATATGVDGGSGRLQSVVRKTPLQLAQEMVNSYFFDKRTGDSTFIVPAGVTDVEAIKALNEYFRTRLSRFKRDAVNADDLDWYQKLPETFPQHCQQRDYSNARPITVHAVVKGTKGEKRSMQGRVLKLESLVFSDPRDQAIAAALHACKHDGSDLFRDLWVRGSVPGVALYAGQVFGVEVGGHHDAYGLCNVAASGSPSPKLK